MHITHLHSILLSTTQSSLPLTLSQRFPFENLVLADCGIGLGHNGGSTSREMIGSYPWGQAGGVSTRMPNGEVFNVYINPRIKDPNSAGDSYNVYEMSLPLKCYSYLGQAV
ncbi:hypothetical protein BJX99DRAFT_258728 [Aspergillus californicus]